MVKIVFKTSLLLLASLFIPSCQNKSVQNAKRNPPAPSAPTTDSGPVNNEPPGSIVLNSPAPNTYLGKNIQLSGSCNDDWNMSFEGDLENTFTKHCEQGSFTADVVLSDGDGLKNLVLKIVSPSGIITDLNVSFNLDTTPPSLPGIPDDGVYSQSTTQAPALSWAQSIDAGIGLSHYEYQIGTSAGQGDLLPWTNLNTSSIPAQTISGIQDGQSYFVSLRAVDLLGNKSTIVNSDGWMVDASAPALVTNIVDGVYKNSLTQSPDISWTASSDTASGIARYEYSVGTAAGLRDILSWTSSLTTNPGVLSLSGLSDGGAYYVNVRVVDNAGNTSSVASSDAWIVDVSSPSSIAQVLDGSFSSSLSNSPAITWTSSVDTGSGLNRYEYSIGTSAGATDVLPWVSTQNTSLPSGISGLSLANGEHYFVNLRSVDNAGNISNISSSDSWLVDNMTPTAVSAINDGVKYYSTISSPAISWSAAVDNGSGISRYDYSLGTSAGAVDVLAWTSNSTSTNLASINALNLVPGQRIYVNVRVVDNAGNISSVSSSDGWIPYRNPKEITNLVAWYRADSLNNNNNSAISTWPDESGNNLNLNSNSVARSPLLITNAIGNLPVLRFDGSNDFMINDALATAMKTASGASLFYVMKNNIQTGTHVLAALQNLGSTNDVFHVGFSANQFYFKTKTTGTTVIKTTGTQNHGVNSVYSSVFDNVLDKVTLQQNSVVKLNASYTTPATEINFANSGRFSLGQEWDSSNSTKPSDFLKADVAELFIYKKAVSASERLDLENYLKAKYGL